MPWKSNINKKVLLRERKRHTARRVVSTPSVLAGGGGSGYSPPGGGVRVPPRGGPGTPPPLPHGILGNVAKHYGIWVPPLWTDRLMDGQTRVKTLPSLVLRTRAVNIELYYFNYLENLETNTKTKKECTTKSLP